MRILSEKQALQKLHKLKTDYRDLIKREFEHRAKSCLTCPTQGACCTDAHFVNVHITRLEAVAIRESLKKFDQKRQQEIFERAAETVKKYDLQTPGDTFAKTFACPLFEKGTGCTIHPVKPTACIQHACYERREDLPPDELQRA